MAPSRIDSPIPEAIRDTLSLVNGHGKPAKAVTKPSATKAKPGFSVVKPFDAENYKYANLLPRFPDVEWEPLEEVPYEDKGLLGDPDYKNLLSGDAEWNDYVPKIGTEIKNVSLKNLNDAQKNDLARLIAFRGCVMFRGQHDFTMDDQLNLGRYFGHLHKHATTSVPKQEGYEEVHVIFTGPKTQEQRAVFTPTHLWHADVTYEIQPPSYTSLRVLSGPPAGAGGDTLWSSQYHAYDLMSEPMQKMLEGLSALHSAQEQADGAHILGRTVRRTPIVTKHPLIRTNPVTGWKSLFFSPGFVTKIVGIPKLESDIIIEYLNKIVAETQEAHCRYQWNEGDIVFWDNRSTNHTASYGFLPHSRHGVRVTPQGEKPFFDPASKSQEDEILPVIGVAPVNKDGSRESNYND